MTEITTVYIHDQNREPLIGISEKAGLLIRSRMSSQDCRHHDLLAMLIDGIRCQRGCSYVTGSDCPSGPPASGML